MRHIDTQILVFEVPSSFIRNFANSAGERFWNSRVHNAKFLKRVLCSTPLLQFFIPPLLYSIPSQFRHFTILPFYHSILLCYCFSSKDLFVDKSFKVGESKHASVAPHVKSLNGWFSSPRPPASLFCLWHFVHEGCLPITTKS